ncbi:hypothetical protein FACS189487_10530 [Campylobacterota bacterium]|nr:hypothetical protein FACS189487_10530 [Campylobacterota bacterium]
MARGGIPAQKNKGGLSESARVVVYSIANFGVWLMGSGVIAIFFGQATTLIAIGALAFGSLAVITSVAMCKYRERGA